ncbi:hypothetical protein [Agarivorans gilvus]|uniref:DUF5671 domain-containing protein n=1 Tax=Agarivorans gilvus TaxID=680279 RepID=A0ABQ1I573_9ALTE|nr:hypothetical protein [Agarivorans gilvus]GGB12436.1 hypothetical protein GCM10007414_27250 [Agarivorans gilvus]
MIKKHTPKTALLACLAFFILFNIFTLALFYSNMLSEFSTQISGQYPVIYLDVSYCFLIAGAICTLACSILMLWQYICLKKNNLALTAKHRSVRVFILVVIVSVAFVLPGRHIEKSRIEKIAEQYGYQPCPPFTLLIGSATIDAWVKDFSLCNDPEVDKLARYGYPGEPAQIAKVLANRDPK